MSIKMPKKISDLRIFARPSFHFLFKVIVLAR